MRFNGRATTDAQALTSLVAADGTSGGFIKDSQAGNLPATATNDSASAGNLGEFISSTVLDAAQVSLTTNQSSNITSISLTAGDWDVWGNIRFVVGVGTLPTVLLGWIDSVSATPPTEPNGGAYFRYGLAFPASVSQSFPVGMRRISLSSTTTIYLSCFATFTVSTLGAYGFLGARRVR